MAASIPGVLRKVSKDKQRSGMTRSELENFFIKHEYGIKKAMWDVHELIVSAQLQTKKDLVNENGAQLYFAIYWPFSGLTCDDSRLCAVQWGRRREYCQRVDGKEDYEPWILDGPYMAVSAHY